MLPRANRLRYGHKKILRLGQRKKTGYFIIIYKPNHLQSSRFSIMATKKIGKAHIRNKVKRLFREIIMHHIEQVSLGYDIIIIPSHFIPSWKDIHVDAIEPLLLNVLTSL